MIVNVRGTHGSGKSTLVRSLMDGYGPRQPVREGYRVQIPWLKKPLYVVGPYDSGDCGGCDRIIPYDRVWEIVKKFADEDEGHVLFEGALISSTYGSIGYASAEYDPGFVFALLDTPLQKCLDRVQQRRAGKGNDKPLNPKSTSDKHKAALRACERAVEQFGRQVVVLNHLNALPKLLGIYRGSECNI